MSDWRDGEVKHVQGSGKKPYELKYTGGVYSCSCPAWRNQSNPIDKRTCKHLKKLRGDAVEEARVAGIQQHGTTTGRTQSAAPNQATPPREAANPMMDADYKIKLFGPPVLLAHPFEDADQDPTGWYMSEKLDGVRAYWDGKQFISRQGNVFCAPEWFKAGLPDHPLDGELWIDRRSFQQTISIVKSIDAGERWKAVKYLAFDLPHLKTPFEERYAELETLCLNSPSKILKIVQQEMCRGPEHLKQELDRLVALGAEGLMIRKHDACYEAGRSWSILKVKPWKDAEATVTDYEPGKGRHKGRTGGLVVKTDDGISFNIGTGLSDEDRRHPPKIGARITFRYMDKTDAGVPKGASFVCVRDYE